MWKIKDEAGTIQPEAERGEDYFQKQPIIMCYTAFAAI